MGTAKTGFSHDELWSVALPGDGYAIYQLKEDAALRDIRFESLERLHSKGLTVDSANYNVVYSGSFRTTPSTNDTLVGLWEKFNLLHPDDYKGHSLSVSDVIALKLDNQISCYYVDRFSFVKLKDFIKTESFLDITQKTHAQGTAMCKQSVADKLAEAEKKPKRKKSAPNKGREMEL